MKKPVRLRERYPEPSRRAPQRRPPLSLPPRQDGTRRERNPRAWRPLDNRRQPSMGAAANGGGTSSTAANRTTSAPRRRGAAKRATTRRKDLAILRSTQKSGQPLGQSMCGANLEVPVGRNRDSSEKSLATLNYLEIKQIMGKRGNGYSVLLAVCSAICPASFWSRSANLYGQNILVNESIFFMPFILFFVRMVDIFHSITNEWAKFDSKDMFFFYFFSHASPTSTP